MEEEKEEPIIKLKINLNYKEGKKQLVQEYNLLLFEKSLEIMKKKWLKFLKLDYANIQLYNFSIDYNNLDFPLSNEDDLYMILNN